MELYTALAWAQCETGVHGQVTSRTGDALTPGALPPAVQWATMRHAAFSRRAHRQPAAPQGAGGRRGGRGDRRGDPLAGAPRPQDGDRRRVSPRVVAPGL